MSGKSVAPNHITFMGRDRWVRDTWEERTVHAANTTVEACRRYVTETHSKHPRGVQLRWKLLASDSDYFVSRRGLCTSRSARREEWGESRLLG